MQDCCLEQHLEGVIKKDQHSIHSAAVPRAVEVLDTKYERVDGFAQKQSSLTLHARTSSLCVAGAQGPAGAQISENARFAASVLQIGPRKAWIISPTAVKSAGAPGKPLRDRYRCHS